MDGLLEVGCFLLDGSTLAAWSRGILLCEDNGSATSTWRCKLQDAKYERRKKHPWRDVGAWKKSEAQERAMQIMKKRLCLRGAGARDVKDND